MQIMANIFIKTWFHKHLSNGENVKRQCLIIYIYSAHNIYCFLCILVFVKDTF